MTDPLLPLSIRSSLRPMFSLLGVACIFVGVAWSSQAMMFAGNDTPAAQVTWIILSAVAAGIGVGLLLAGFFWVRRPAR